MRPSMRWPSGTNCTGRHCWTACLRPSGRLCTASSPTCCSREGQPSKRRRTSSRRRRTRMILRCLRGWIRCARLSGRPHQKLRRTLPCGPCRSLRLMTPIALPDPQAPQSRSQQPIGSARPITSSAMSSRSPCRAGRRRGYAVPSLASCISGAWTHKPATKLNARWLSQVCRAACAAARRSRSSRRWLAYATAAAAPSSLRALGRRRPRTTGTFASQR